MFTDPIDELEQRFTANVERVGALVKVGGLAANPAFGAFGRPPAVPRQARDDLLRAAVVFLHAALEDLIRTIEGLRLPSASAEHLDDLRLIPPGGGWEKGLARFTLKDLAAWRGSSVDRVIGVAADAYLERSSYSDIEKVIGALKRAGLLSAWDASKAPALASMMKRRHLIAHYADRSFAAAAGSTSPIDPATVASWTELVRTFGERVIAELKGSAA